MRLLVVGAGSTGGYFGGRLAQAGYDVVFLVRPARETWLRREGLRITSPHGDATLHPQLVIAGAIDKPFEVVLLTVKGFQLAAAIEEKASQLAALDRYERRALSRRKFAIRKFDANG